MKKGFSDMTDSLGHLCCALAKALALDPVPVIQDMVYVPGAEGLRLTDITNSKVDSCESHRFTFTNTVRRLMDSAYQDAVPCSCSTHVFKGSEHVKGYVHVTCVGGERRVLDQDTTLRIRRRTLWAYEMDNVVAAYKWLMHNRTRLYPMCCKAVLVYQLKKSPWLPPGLYIYRTQPAHFGCTQERPLRVVDQFNFRARSHSLREGLPSAITIDMYPGRDNLSVLYVITRKLAIAIAEYGNRVFGEAKALGIDPSSSTSACDMRACEHYEVSMRTERACVIDLRWKGFDTKTECIKAIPRVRGMQAVLWSNHTHNIQEVECKVLTWLFGLSNELPREVQMVDYTREDLCVRYIILDMDTFQDALPEPPRGNGVFFIHTHFTGDRAMATKAIGDVSGLRSRMGSPCPASSPYGMWYCISGIGHYQPTPFSCGLEAGSAENISEVMQNSILEWTLSHDGTACEAIGVQCTLYVRGKEYKMMVSHTMLDSETLPIFRL